jgi:hypothetical protein
VRPPRRTASSYVPAAIALVVAVLGIGGGGCAHAVRIETEPPGATVVVDGERVGRGPATLQRTVFIGDQLRIAVAADGYEPATVVVPAQEWTAWPTALACTPALGVPLAVPFLVGFLPLCGAGLVVGPAVAVGWAVVTSPTLLALGMARKYPDVVRVKLKPRSINPLVLPGEFFYVPDDDAPNPPPLSDGPPASADDTAIRPAPSGTEGRPAAEANPVP